MRPRTLNDWLRLIAAFCGVVGVVAAAIDRDWAGVIWPLAFVLACLSGYTAGRAADDWRDAYHAAKARADLAQWGENLS